jgi:hypothetical protein
MSIVEVVIHTYNKHKDDHNDRELYQPLQLNKQYNDQHALVEEENFVW